MERLVSMRSRNEEHPATRAVPFPCLLALHSRGETRRSGWTWELDLDLALDLALDLWRRGRTAWFHPRTIHHPILISSEQRRKTKRGREGARCRPEIWGTRNSLMCDAMHLIRHFLRRSGIARACALVRRHSQERQGADGEAARPQRMMALCNGIALQVGSQVDFPAHAHARVHRACRITM